MKINWPHIFHKWKYCFTRKHNEYFECDVCQKRKVKRHIYNGTIAPVDQHWIRHLHSPSGSRKRNTF